MQQEKKRRAGWLYKQTASRLLWRYYPEMLVGQHTHLLEVGDYDQLEGFVEVEEYLKVVADVVKDRLTEIGISLPSNFEDVVLFAEDPGAELNEARSLCAIAHLTSGEKGEFALEIVKAVHELWVASFTDHFFVKDESYKLYRFMPLELIGFERVEYFHYIYASPLFSALGLDVDNIYIERAYDHLQDAALFDGAVRIRDKESLCAVIANLDYDPLAPGIQAILKKEPRLVAKIAAQVIGHNPVLRGE